MYPALGGLPSQGLASASLLGKQFPVGFGVDISLTIRLAKAKKGSLLNDSTLKDDQPNFSPSGHSMCNIKGGEGNIKVRRRGKSRLIPRPWQNAPNRYRTASRFYHPSVTRALYRKTEINTARLESSVAKMARSVFPNCFSGSAGYLIFLAELTRCL